ncbi:hypothetical protein BC835DRAFT_1417312 [Cytidiella melzeri]|nr:hypothetical protein BC835DRAFT_1417312 [Cytidiella melzeri]
MHVSTFLIISAIMVTNTFHMVIVSAAPYSSIGSHPPTSFGNSDNMEKRRITGTGMTLTDAQSLMSKTPKTQDFWRLLATAQVEKERPADGGLKEAAWLVAKDIQRSGNTSRQNMMADLRDWLKSWLR